jgi:peptidyl-prolyl cis-trans isomerase D
VYHVQAVEDEPAMLSGRLVPSVSAWAFGGARVGETSELFDDDNGYYLARLDTLRPGGEPKFENVKEDVRARVAAEKAVDQLMPAAQKLAAAAATSSLDAAAKQADKKVEQTPMFSRSSFVPGLGQFSEPIGAAFGLPVGAVSQPVKSTNGVFVIRVDKRVLADSSAWAAQKQAQRATRLQQLRQQRLQMFISDIRKAAKVDDRRKQIQAATRRQET